VQARDSLKSKSVMLRDGVRAPKTDESGCIQTATSNICQTDLDNVVSDWKLRVFSQSSLFCCSMLPFRLTLLTLILCRVV